MTNIPRRPAAKGVIYPEELRDILAHIQASQEEQLKNQQRLEIQVTQLQASVPTRVEIQALLAERVPQAVYRVEYDGMKTDIAELKNRLDARPTTAWNRTSIVISLAIALGALIISMITLLR